MSDNYKPKLEFTKKNLQEAEKISLQLLQGTPLCKIQKIPKDHLDTMGYLAINSYKSGNNDNALQVYKLLCLYDHTNSKNFLGAGICQQKAEEYEAAIDSYMTAVMLNADSYSSFFNLSQCLLALGKGKLAAEALQEVMNIGNRNPEVKSSNTYQKAKKLLAGLKM